MIRGKSLIWPRDSLNKGIFFFPTTKGRLSQKKRKCIGRGLCNDGERLIKRQRVASKKAMEYSDSSLKNHRPEGRTLQT